MFGDDMPPRGRQICHNLNISQLLLRDTCRETHSCINIFQSLIETKVNVCECCSENGIIMGVLLLGQKKKEDVFPLYGVLFLVCFV